ncbi:Mitogen-activated protein kinase kinase kinase 15 [Halotydeus destructor]|nr:Mitogen-activated protein kinase kinase kinase 15 [Halotydeus destructor]
MSESDIRSIGTNQGSKPKVDVACIIDWNIKSPGSSTEHRKLAFEEIQKACHRTGAILHHIPFQKLDFGEAVPLDQFYSSDAAIVDLSIADQQNALFYHLGVRESFKMKHNILLFNEVTPESGRELRLSCSKSTYALVTYKVEEKHCLVTESSAIVDGSSPGTLNYRIRKLLQDVEVQTKAHMKEKFLTDLRKARETYTGAELSQVLHSMRKRLDDPNIISSDVVHTMLLSFRDIQDYDAMVQLIDDLETVPNLQFTSTPAILPMYAYALNRRNNKGDREKALAAIDKGLLKPEFHVQDLICLCGRIYKDLFEESDYTDMDTLAKAIEWYRKGFEMQQSEYAGINLATLSKGSLASLQDYWDVAIFFEISVLAENYGKAIQGAECMFRLNQPRWYLKSTIRNIKLISRFRRKPEDAILSPEEQVFMFWMEYFINATMEESEVNKIIRFPMLVLEASKEYVPSYVTINLDAEEKSMHIENMCIECLKDREKCHKPHDWLLLAHMIRGVSLYKRDERGLFLYVHLNSDDFHMFFPSDKIRQRLYDLVLEMTDQSAITDFGEGIEMKPVDFAYDYDESNQKVMLGKGTYGAVFAAHDTTTNTLLAVKEITIKNQGEVQPLREEIKLHSQLRHKNIVQYLGSVCEEGKFKILMELVPGGSLTQLICTKWGAMSEPTIAYYTKQILQGLKYLHDQNIVHRDIKGDNVLLNTYSGIAKISDFGTSKRLAGLNPNTETFTGTFQYMAPEVIDQGQRGYGAPADIWSLGCTVVEMATGKTPFFELGSGPQIIFHVGNFKAHPEIPDSLGERAKNFILRCFDPDPSKRATATELMADAFLAEPSTTRSTHRKKSPATPQTPSPLRVTSHIDFNRSISVPESGLASPTIPGTRVHRLAGSAEDNSSGKLYLNVHHSSPSDIETPSPHFQSSISLSSDDGPFGRRNSASVTSPPVDGFSSTVSDVDQGGFYLLKKDSQRRATLVQVFNSDNASICNVWLQDLQNNLPSSQPVILQSNHLSVLLRGLRDYLPEQNKDSISKALSELKEELEYDPAVTSQLQLALCLFQNAVNRILRGHNIKPHWMFALDNLVRTAVHAAISIISPELGENLAGSNLHQGSRSFLDDSRMSIDETKPIDGPAEVSHKSLLARSYDRIDSTEEDLDHEAEQLKEKYKRIKAENVRLWREKCTLEKTIQDMLKDQLQDKKRIVQFLQDGKGFLENNLPSSSLNSPLVPTTPIIVLDKEVHDDPELVTWLEERSFDHEVVEKFTLEGYTKEDVISLISRDDIRRMNLKGGVELRLWREILAVRAPGYLRQLSDGNPNGLDGTDSGMSTG